MGDVSSNSDRRIPNFVAGNHSVSFSWILVFPLSHNRLSPMGYPGGPTRTLVRSDWYFRQMPSAVVYRASLFLQRRRIALAKRSHSPNWPSSISSRIPRILVKERLSPSCPSSWDPCYETAAPASDQNANLYRSGRDSPR